MKVEIVKTPARRETKIVRDDGVTLALRGPDRKFSPPHDAVHLLVERVLGLENGFWGTVAAGAKFSSMTVAAGRQPPHAETRSKALIKSNRRALNEAEVYVGVFQQALQEHPKAYRDVIARRLKENGRTIDFTDIERIWASLVALRSQWEALPVGESIVLEWPKVRRLQSRSA